MSRLMKKAFAISVPARKPQVSKLASVFLYASRRNVVLKVGGRKMVRKGVPFSRYAAGANTCTGSGVSDLFTAPGITLAGGTGSPARELLGLGGTAGGGLNMSLEAAKAGAYGSAEF